MSTSHIYSQGKQGHCAGYAIAYGIGKAMGQFPVPDLVKSFYSSHDKGIEGMRIIEIADILRTEKLGVVRCIAWEKIYAKNAKTKAAKERNKFAMSKLHRALQLPCRAVLLSTKAKLDLDSKFYAKPNQDGFEHALCLDSVIQGKYYFVNGFKIANSWGEKWGDNGYFNVKKDDLLDFAEDVYILTFSVNKP